ncbi:MAG: type II CRISPR RNA-guided endonuclease Cas9, partial [Lachnospiraceae bacterium]|nr:type II CRISPR RNA-guided endonuclease Cas9 [Lachnospiraceae bacterium]
MVFRASSKDLKNYTAYSYNLKSVKGNSYPKGKASAEEFYSFLKKELQLDKIEVEDCDREFYEDMMTRISEDTFLPKQVNTDNRVIPYQLYLSELKKILDNASAHYSFLNEKDAEGYVNKEKLVQIFKFRIPYFVGPLRTENTKYGWMRRKTDGIIRPWNFNEKVDIDASEDAFINRMTNTCTYIPGEKVLPKWSVLYSKFTVLNEINNITVNSMPIEVEAKQGIYNELFCKNAKVSVKRITDYLISTGRMQPADTLGGLDITVKSSLKPIYEFRHLLNNKALNMSNVEKIVERCTYTEDKLRYKSWLKRNYSSLSEDDLKYIGKLNYKDFGRLSAYFMNDLKGVNKDTGEMGTIIHFLWETNDNLMQILSDRYTFMEEISKLRREYYTEHPLSLNEQRDDMGMSNAVKRPVTRTLAVVDDIVSSIGYAPKKIFVEMARGADEKKKRTVTRKDQILALYKKVRDEDTSELEKQLESMGDTANNKLQSESLFLYYMQLGKCMYSGQPISLSELKT